MKNQFSNHCKSCGSEYVYNVKKEVLNCIHCNSIVFIERDGPIRRRNYSPSVEHKPSLMRTLQYKCSNCGNIHAIVSKEPLKRCPSCASNALTKLVDMSMVPDGIIPFKLDRDDAALCFQKWLKSRKLAPKDLKTLAKNKKVSASYYPVWSYDYNSIVSFTYVGIRRSDDSVKRYRRSGTTSFSDNDQLVSASSKISSKTLTSLGSFGLKKLQPFFPAYTYGWSASVNDIDVHRAYSVFTNEAHKAHELAIIKQIKKEFDDYSHFYAYTNFTDTKYRYIYLPIWLNHYDYKNKDYHCYINGATGKTHGNSPVSKAKVGLIVLGLLALGLLLIYLHLN